MWAPAIWPCLSWNCEIIDHEWHAQLQHSSFSSSSSSPSSSLFFFFFFLFFLCSCSPLVALVSTACVRLQQHRCHIFSRTQWWRLSSGRCFSLSCCCSFLLVPSRPSTYPELLPGTSHRWVKSRPIFCLVFLLLCTCCVVFSLCDGVWSVGWSAAVLWLDPTLVLSLSLPLGWGLFSLFVHLEREAFFQVCILRHCFSICSSRSVSIWLLRWGLCQFCWPPLYSDFPVDDEESVCSLYAVFDQIITSVQIRHLLLHLWSMDALCMLRFGIAWNPPIETKRDPQN